MAQSSAVLLLDDGELDDVQEILEELQVDFARIRGGAIAPDTPPPKSLLVATPRRIPSHPEGAQEAPVRIVVVSEDSTKLRDQLREIGFDYLVRRPVHPEALRLLIMHSLYRGEERRGEPRVAVGLEISFRTGVLARRATLVDLSSRGCRLISAYALEPGRRIRLQVPESLGASEAFTIDGEILRTSFDERLGTDGMYSAAVTFRDLSNEARHELEWIIEDKASGPPALRDASGRGSEWLDTEAVESPPAQQARPMPRAHRRPTGSRRTILERVSPRCPPDPRTEGSELPPAPAAASDPTSAAEAPDQAESAQAPPISVPVDVKLAPIPGDTSEPAAEPQGADSQPPEERRAADRHPFGAKVPAFGTRALRVLIGRDLSAGGMRIESHPDLEVGDRLHLAIYGAAGEEPFLIWGTIARDGSDGMGVVFDPVHTLIAEKLEKLLASLPTVESLHDDEAAAMGTVMSEILDD